MQVKDIMEPLTGWLNPQMPMTQAIEVMRDTKRGHGLSINGIIVLNHEMKLVGMVSTKDILRALIPSYMYIDGIMDQTNWQELRLERTQKANKLTVADIMTEDVRVISYNDSIMRCADLMLVEQLRRLPVIGTDGRVLGIIYLREVYNTVIKLLCDSSAYSMVA